MHEAWTAVAAPLLDGDPRADATSALALLGAGLLLGAIAVLLDVWRRRDRAGKRSPDGQRGDRTAR